MSPAIAPTVEAFLAQLENVSWFSNLGAPTPPDARVVRMLTWDDWPGPEEPAVLELFAREHELYERIIDERDADDGLMGLSKRVRKTVMRSASNNVPFDPDEDPWHAPSAAVWQAAYITELIALCLQTGRDVPPGLHEQWNWFVRGHWPAGCASLDDPGWLLVY
jgi:hypothetical protein